MISAFYSQLADLLQSGVPLLKSLDILEKQSSNQATCRSRCARSGPRVADGTTLADAMKPFPKVFNELAVSMVRAGQEGGFLEDVLATDRRLHRAPGGPEGQGHRVDGLPGPSWRSSASSS